jgi:hypothetical protein
LPRINLGELHQCGGVIKPGRPTIFPCPLGVGRNKIGLRYVKQISN